MPKELYIIAGPNGAGKTTASYVVLPELWDCDEFVNADEIARGLSPFNPESVSIEAGKIQLQRIASLMEAGKTFSIETTLATRSYVNLVNKAHENGYEVDLLFLYLPTPEDAIERVRLRVLSGGHNIPEIVIRRRFRLGLQNLFNLYMPIVDRWQLVNNKTNPPAEIARKVDEVDILESKLFNSLKEHYGSEEL